MYITFDHGCWYEIKVLVEKPIRIWSNEDRLQFLKNLIGEKYKFSSRLADDCPAIIQNLFSNTTDRDNQLQDNEHLGHGPGLQPLKISDTEEDNHS